MTSMPTWGVQVLGMKGSLMSPSKGLRTMQGGVASLQILGCGVMIGNVWHSRGGWWGEEIAWRLGDRLEDKRLYASSTAREVRGKFGI